MFAGHFGELGSDYWKSRKWLVSAFGEFDNGMSHAGER